MYDKDGYSLMEEIKVPEFNPEVFWGNIDAVNNLETILKKNLIQLNNIEPRYLIVKRAFFKRIALKSVYVNTENIIEKYLKEIDEFYAYKINTVANRAVLLFIKESVDREDIMHLKECIVFDKIKRDFFESIEIILMDKTNNKAYFDGLMIKSTYFKYKDTRKLLTNELGFKENPNE